MQLLDDDGRRLDADYLAEPDGSYIALIMESRSGTSGSRPPRNPDYNQALTVLLTRLGQLNALMVDAVVDSRHVRDLGVPESERSLIQAPVRLAAEPVGAGGAGAAAAAVWPGRTQRRSRSTADADV